MNAMLLPNSPSTPPWFQRVLALGVLALTAYAVVDYPYARVFLGIALSVYAAALIALPSVWLLVLPIAMALVNMAPLSGRFYLEDFDFFVWVSVASGFWHGVYSLRRRPRFKSLPWLLIAAFFITHSIAAVRGLLPLTAIDINAFNNYYSPYNALRVGKSLFWAVLLIPLILRAFTADRDRARTFLIFGVCLGLIGESLAICWERGVFSDLLYATNLYGKISGLTDFSSEYRSTGLFAEMHTGGEAIDGYLSMSWPFALGSLAVANTRWKLAFSTVALSLGLYSAVVTFSRGTYAAVAVSLLAFAVPFSRAFIGRAAEVKGSWLVPVALLGTLAACSVLYGKGGYYAILAALGILVGAVALGFLSTLRSELRAVALAGLFVVGFGLMMRGLLTSKWASNGFTESLALCLPVSIGLLLAGLLAGERARSIFTLRGLGVSLLFTAMLIAVSVPALSGSYAKSRFTTVSGDAGGRWEHWQHAIELMDSSWDTYLFGMGLGVFPRAYLLGKETEKSSVATLQQEAGNTYLSMSNSMDLAMGQHVHLQADESYTLSFDAKTQAQNASLNISVCRRHIIVQWDLECVSTGKAIAADGHWQHIEWAFNMGSVGDNSMLGRRPLVLRITHFVYNPQGDNNLPLDFVDVDNLALTDRFGEEFLLNGDFEAGLDHWYPSSDHYHMPLHIKNLWVDVYFEQGGLGLLAFAALALSVLATGVRLIRRGDLFALVLLSALLGELTVGMIGTLYDVPRVIFWFFILEFTLLAQDPALLTHSLGRSGQAHPSRVPAKRGSFVKPPLKTLE